MVEGMAVHLDTDEGNAVMLGEATSFDLYKQEGDGSLVHVGNAPNLAKRPQRVALEEGEAQQRAGAVRYDGFVAAGRPRPRL